MEKQHILDEIVRTAKANKGKPLGRLKFSTETGITYSDWCGKHWARWGEAVKEAGYAPNELQEAYEHGDLLEALAELIRETGRYPANADLRIRARRGDGFPADKTFRRLGNRTEIATRIAKEFSEKAGFEKVVKVCEAVVALDSQNAISKGNDASDGAVEIGDVYLIKSGRNFKIGHSNASGRREREIALQLPDKAGIIHVIKTDDPRGIEAYWHRRFADKRKNGEWFDLTRIDIAAFRRRKTM